MINYDNLKLFLRVSRLGIELAGEINSNKNVMQAANDYSAGLSDNQKAILAQINKMEYDLKTPTLSSVKKNIAKLERLMGCKIPEKAFNTVNIN